LLISTGAIWLLTRSGNLPSSNLWALTHIWPYFLIVAGLGFILRSYWSYTTILMDVIILGSAVLAIVFAPQLGWDNPSMISTLGNGEIYVGPSEPGSGKVITQSREVDDFNAITIQHPAQVTVTQGEAASVKIEAEDNLLPGLQTHVRGNRLEIFYKVADGNYVKPRRPVRITIVVTDLQQVNFESAGDITFTDIKTDALTISVSGAGNLQLEHIISPKLSVSLSGAGSMSASGETDNFDLVISGFGSFDGKDLHSQTANINLSGAGSATIWMKLFEHTSMNRNPLLILTAFLLFTGVQFIVLGLLGELNARTYYEAQGKPIYVVREKINFTD
jgi:hypothetical protein